jgi:hypothetical protein
VGASRPKGDDLGGHPQKVHEFYEKDEEFDHAMLKVGKGKAFVMVLEGQTGEAEVYRLADGTVILAEPPRVWWEEDDAYAKKAVDIAEMFGEAIAPPASSAKKIGSLEVTSGKLVAFYVHADLRPAAKTLKKTAVPGSVKAFGDDEGGVVIALKPGSYVVRRREVTRKWAKDQPLVVAYIVPA